MGDPVFLANSFTDIFSEIDGMHILLGIALIILSVFAQNDRRSEGLVDSAVKLVLPLQRQLSQLELTVEALQRRVADLEFENAELWRWGRINYGRLVEQGHDPEPVPTLVDRGYPI